VRDATPADRPFLADANAAMALETEGRALDRAVLERGIAAVFDRPRRGFYLVAERAGEAVGCLLVTFEWSDWRDGDWWWIQSVYVAPAARRSGVYRALHRDVARRAAEARGVVGLRLYVERDNARAQQAYRTLGMDESPYRLYEQPLPPDGGG
jgi:GNAT superfamily N-acetyltransferase